MLFKNVPVLFTLDCFVSSIVTPYAFNLDESMFPLFFIAFLCYFVATILGLLMKIYVIWQTMGGVVFFIIIVINLLVLTCLPGRIAYLYRPLSTSDFPCTGFLAGVSHTES